MIYTTSFPIPDALPLWPTIGLVVLLVSVAFFSGLLLAGSGSRKDGAQ